MPFLSDEERRLCAAISKLAYCNPFLPERMEHEREVLGGDFDARGPVWDVGSEPAGEPPNIPRIGDRAESLARTLRERLTEGAAPSREGARQYEELVHYVLFHRNRHALMRTLRDGSADDGKPRRIDYYDDFARDMLHFLSVPGVREPEPGEIAHLFACLFQIRRAFQFIHHHIVGASMAAARFAGGHLAVGVHP